MTNLVTLVKVGSIGPLQRKTAYQWILDLAAEIATRVITNVEWRIVAKQCLLKKDLIKIKKAGKVLPHFHQKLCHI